MVHGRADCRAFCPTCKQDCICSCNRCHFCWAKPNIGGTHGIHNCDAYGNRSMGSFGMRTVNLINLFRCEPYTVVVGSEGNSATFQVHKEPLAEASRYFKTLFGFDSTQERKKVVLDSAVDKPSAFSSFLQFAYMHDYFLPQTNSEEGHELITHAEAYVLADRLEAMELKDLALRHATAACVELSRQATEEAKLPQMKDAASWSIAERGIRTIPEVARIVYQNTPSPTSSTGDEDAEKVGEETEKLQDVESSATVTLLDSNDRFRILISRFTATCLNTLKGSSSFSECLIDIPEFAQDVMLKNLAQTGTLTMDEHGELKNI